MTWCEGNDNDAATPRADFACTDDGVGRVIASLHDHVGLEKANQLERCVLVEHGHRIDGFERGENKGTLAFRTNWPVRSFQPFHRGIAVDTHDEHVSMRTGADEHIDVPRVE